MGRRAFARAVFAAGLVVALVASLNRTIAAEEISRSWKLCADSATIIVGTLHVPVDELRAAPKGGTYLNATVSVTETLKGASFETVVVRVFSEDRPYAPTSSQLLGLNDQMVMAFLTTGSNDNGGPANYFAGDTADALRIVSPTEETGIRAEIARQARVLRNWRPHPEWPHEAEVKRLIEKTRRHDTATRAFKDLEKLGPAAAPAMVDLMDDRRPLGVTEISLENKYPGAFERNRIYGPKLVVDALAAILNQITGLSFGFIENGGSEAQRQLMVDRWRIYVDVQKNHRAAGARGTAISI